MQWYSGILIGIITLLIIGMGFPLVIRGERKFGVVVWPTFMLLGVGMIFGSLFIQKDLVSVLVAVIGITFVWGSTELNDQAVRAELGWYPFNPNKSKIPFADAIRKWKPPHL
jgi:hypothetical protein